MDDDRWMGAAVIVLAAFRVTRLVGWDDLTHPLRARVSGLSDDEFLAEMRLPKEDRDLNRLAELLHCPWCVGFWVSLGWTAAYAARRDLTRRVAAPFAVSALVGFAARWLDP